jgi:anti-anti-sigma factor
MPRRSDLAVVTSRPRHVVASGFRCSTVQGPGKASWVNAAGELDVSVAPLVAEVLQQAARRSRLVVLDLREVTRVDSSGVGVLVHASVDAQRTGRRIVLIRGLSQVDRLLSMTGSTHAVEIIDLAVGEPATQALLHINRREVGGARAAARVARRVVTFMPRQHAVARGVGALKSRKSELPAPLDN